MEPDRLVKPVTPGDALGLGEPLRFDGQVRLGKPATMGANETDGEFRLLDLV